MPVNDMIYFRNGEAKTLRVVMGEGGPRKNP